MKKNIWLIVFILVFLTQLYSETQIPSGFISGSWNFSDSPFYINGEVSIPDGETLSIEPGVKIIFTGFYKFNVQGQLLAIGEENNLIHFTVNDTTGFNNHLIVDGGWNAIRFDHTPVENDSSKIIFCKLEYGKACGDDLKLGGAVFIRDFSKILISNSIITNNLAGRIASGAGIYCNNANLVLKDNEISNNYVEWGSGGGIYCVNSTVHFENNIFKNNVANLTGSLGGAVYCEQTNPTFINNTFENNIASGTASNGGGIYANIGTEQLLIKNNNFTNNQLYGNCGTGSALRVVNFEEVIIDSNHFNFNRGSISLANITNINLTGNLFENNQYRKNVSINADSVYFDNNELINNEGGGLFLSGLFARIENNTITENSSNNDGTAINASSVNIEIENNIISNNNCFSQAGAIYVENIINGIIRNNEIKDNYATGKGGAVYCKYSKILIENNLFSNNSSESRGGAVYCWGTSDDSYIKHNVFEYNNSIGNRGGAIYYYGFSNDFYITNNTFIGNAAENDGGAIYSNDSYLKIENCIFWINYPDQITGTCNVKYCDVDGGYPGTGNINSNPLFEDLENGVYLLTENSPCIDAGNPSSPPDPDGTIPDLGAFYYHHLAVYSDFEADTLITEPPFIVHFTDLSHSPNTDILTWQWDFENDGIIDSYDQNPTHEYLTEGLYSVSLTITGEENTTDFLLKENYINVHTPMIFNIPEDIATIQEGIDLAIPGDTLLISPGVYYENIDFKGKNIVVASHFLTTQDSSYIMETIIDGNQMLNTVRFTNGEDSTAVLCGLTITNGFAEEKENENGGGILCIQSSPTLTNLIIKENIAINGAGIAAIESNPTIINSIITNNHAHAFGGGIHFSSSSNPILKYSIIAHNQANSAASIGSYDSNLNIDNITITENTSDTGYGIKTINTNLVVNSSILWNPDEIEIGMDSYSESNTLEVINSNIENGLSAISNSDGEVNWHVGNITSEPLFGDNFSLTENSPCIDKGNPESKLDPDGTITDIGFEYFNQGIHEHLDLLYFTAHFQENGSALIEWTSSNENNVMEFKIYRGENENAFYEDSAILVNTINGSGTTSDHMQYSFEDENNLLPGINYYYWLESINNGGVTEIFGFFPLLNVSRSNIHVSLTGSDESGYGTEESPFLTVQHAIDYAKERDTIYVHPGIYFENIQCSNKKITIGSLFLANQDTSYVSQTILSGCFNGPVITFSSVEGNETKLTGFTITEGSGSGILFDNSSPDISFVKITLNETDNYGGGISCINNSNPIIRFSEISNNNSLGSGGGISCRSGSSPIFINVTIVNNLADYLGGGITVIGNSYPTLINSIMWNNHPFEPQLDGGDLYIYYSDIERSWPGEGNLDVNPILEDLFGDIYYLSVDSPCIDAGTSYFEIDNQIVVNYSEDEYYGSAPDMGCYELNTTGTDDENINNIKNQLFQNYPNPFNPITTINFTTTKSAIVSLDVFNIKGQKVKTLVDKHLKADFHSVKWFGDFDSGKKASSGIYFYKLSIDGKAKEIRKCLLVK